MQTTIKNNSATNALGEFLKTSKKQYKSLSKDEERKLIEDNRADEGRCRELLVLHNIRLVFSMARKYAATSVDFDDLIGRGFEGLCIAASKFDLDKGTKFITYASPWVFKYILQEFYDKDITASKTGISLNSPISSEDTEDSAVFENVINHYVEPTHSIPQISNDVAIQAQRNEAENIYNDLINFVIRDNSFDAVDKELFQRNLIEKDSIREISSDLNIPYAVVNKKKKDILLKLRGYLKDHHGINALDEI